MEQITIKNLGVSALLIEGMGRRILVDAFNTMLQPVKVLPGDIIMFTHDDGDHFSPNQLPKLIGQEITIIGPPSIVKPILLQGKADITQIETLYTGDNAVPAGISYDQISIKCYHTTHFNHWNPIHNSYLIEAQGKRLYITGDSLVTKELMEDIGETNAVICNLVEEGFLKGYTEGKVAIHHLLSYLLKLRTDGRAKSIIGVHLVDCPFTVDADALITLLEEFDFRDIIIPVSTEQRITIV